MLWFMLGVIALVAAGESTTIVNSGVSHVFRLCG